MSVAKPTLEYIRTIRTPNGLSGSTAAFRTILRYHRPYVRTLVIIAGLALLSAYLFSLEPIYTAQIIDRVIIAGHQELLLGLVLKIVLAVVIFGAVDFSIAYLQGRTAQLMVRDIRSDYYSSLQAKSFRFYDSSATGDLVSRATLDMQAVEAFLKTWVGVSTGALFTATIVSVVMYSISPAMSLLAILPMPFIFYLTVRLWTSTMPLFRRMQLTLGRLGAYVQQNILGMKIVRILRREAEMEEGFEQIQGEFVGTAIRAGKIQSRYMPSSPAILTLGIVLVYLYGGNLIVSASSLLTIGELTLFARYMLRLSFPLRDLSMLSGTWINASAGLERIRQIMDAPVDVGDRPASREIDIGRGEVEFRDVTFGYASERPVLRNVSFRAMPGEKIAILGSTGSGKTSLVYLIPRFYDVGSGSVLIDGVDVRDFTLSSLRRQIGLVLQDVFIFTGTIRDNIAFGKPDASDEDVVNAAKLARIHDFIETLPEGYSTVVGERGVTLSGGQRQRITIARALLVDPRILIFDDALSFVDAKTEKEIQAAIEEAMRGRTSFIIAQRLSTIRNADRIMVLDNGEVAEFGTHAELITSGRIYRRIYRTQFLERAPEEIVEVDAR